MVLAAAPARGGVLALEGIRIARVDLHIEELAGAVRLRGLALKREAPGGGWSVHLDRLLLDGAPPALAPLALEGSLRPTADGLLAQGALRFSAGGAEIAFEAFRSAEDGTWSLYLEGEVSFQPGRLAPRHLSPRYGGILSETEGRIGFTAHLQRGADSTEVAELVLEDLTFTAFGVRFRGLRGALLFDRLFPPRTLPGQRLELAEIDFGLPLRDLQLLFALEPGAELALQRAGAELLGARLRVAPSRLALLRPEGRVKVRLSGLELPRLVRALDMPGLVLEGVVDGELLLAVRPSGALEILASTLTARGPGILRYRPPAGAAAVSEHLRLLYRALENFHYARMEAKLSGPLAGELRLLVHLEGANPDLYGGQPFVLNLSFEGPFGRMLRYGLRSYELPGEIERRLRKRMQ